MSLDQVLLLACLVVTSFPVATSNDAENEIHPIRRSQYGLLRGLRLKTEPWYGEIESERDGNSGYDYHDRRSTDWAEPLPWKDLLEAGFGPREGQLEVDVFLGIQYASLLNSNLRFMPPTGPTESWHGAPRNATAFRPVCPQPTAAELMKRAKTFEEMEKWRVHGRYLDYQEEECLFLNVFVPVAKNKDHQRRECVLRGVIWVNGSNWLKLSCDYF